MAETTTLLGMTLPGTSDPADITQINGNFNLIETFLQTYVRASGVGTTARSIDSLDNAAIFALHSSNVGVPPIAGKVYWDALTIPDNASRSLQIAYRTTGNPLQLAIRRKTSGEWGEWEYINPPMYEGEEYKTTERWSNKAVYAKRVAYATTDVGEDGKTTSITIPHGISNLDTIISCNSKLGQYFLPYMSTGGGLTILAQHTATSLVVRTNGTWSGERVWTFDMRYTKT